MQKNAKIKIGKIILMTVAAVGFLSIAVLAPNAVQAIEIFSQNKKRKYNTRWYVEKSIIKLKNQGLIKFEKRDGKIFARLTEKGERGLLKYQLKELIIKKPKKWDNKWRIIIFDISEYKKKIRDGFRIELINLGFFKLQNSVWAYPYDCEEIIFMLKTYFFLGKDVLYMTVEKIENDGWLKRKFKID